MPRICLALVASALLMLAHPLSAVIVAEPEDALKTILSLSGEGLNNEEAAVAWKTIVAQGGESLIPTLTAFDKANPVAANWLRSAVSAIVETERKASRPLPATLLVAFVKDKARNAAARRIAYELLAAEQPATAEELLATLIDDADQDLRYEAINLRLEKAKLVSPEALVAAQSELLSYVRNPRQAQAIAEALEKAGKPVNLTKFFNYITEWHIVGPFDNTDGIGFNQAFPPERMIDLAAEYQGKEGPIRWGYVQSDQPNGKIDLNKELGKFKNATAYATATIVSNSNLEQPIDIRANSPGAVQFFLNGKQVFSREIYHNNGGMDAFIGKGALKPGENQLLVKICQNDMTQVWAQTWEFELRVCDETGGRVELQQSIRRNDKEQPILVPLSELKPVAPNNKGENKGKNPKEKP